MGYTISSNTQHRFTSNADFQAWGSWISNGIANTGLVKTADSGQVDWTTVAMPAAGGAIQGYEIWRFNDALQNSAPVFLKMEYGAATSSANVPGYRWTLASGSTGNGTLSGLTSRDHSTANAWTWIQENGQFANATLLSYLSGDVNRLVIAGAVRGTGSATAYSSLLSLERTVDANGTVTADGVLVAYFLPISPAIGQVVWSPIVGHICHETPTFGILAPQKGAGVTGGNTAVYPVFHTWGGGAFLNPGLNLLAYWNGEFTAGSANAFTYYNASHTYMPLGNTAIPTGGINARGNTSMTFMMRWE